MSEITLTSVVDTGTEPTWQLRVKGKRAFAWIRQSSNPSIFRVWLEGPGVPMMDTWERYEGCGFLGAQIHALEKLGAIDG